MLKSEGSLINRWVLVRKTLLKKHLRKVNDRMFFVTGGFGADPKATGNACLGHHTDGYECRYERHELDRFARDNEVKKYAMNTFKEDITNEEN